MRAVGLKTLKNKLSEYVRLASQGETILVADRDNVVAELVPPRQSRSTNLLDAQLAELVRNGLLAPALIASKDEPKISVRRVERLKSILKELDEDRGG